MGCTAVRKLSADVYRQPAHLSLYRSLDGGVLSRAAVDAVVWNYLVPQKLLQLPQGPVGRGHRLRLRNYGPNPTEHS